MLKLAEQLVDLTMKMDLSTFQKVFETRDKAIQNTLQSLKSEESRIQFYNFCEWSINTSKETIQEAGAVQDRLLKLMYISKDNNIPKKAPEKNKKVLEELRIYLEKEYEETVRCIEKTPEKHRNAMIQHTIHRCLGATMFAQHCEISFDDVDTLYMNIKDKLEALKV